MKTYVRIFLWATVMFASLGFWLHAYAQDGGAQVAVATPTAPLLRAGINWAPYVPLFALICGSFSAWLKAWTPSTGFFHTLYGHGLVIVLAAVAGAGASWFAAGHLTSDALIAGIVGALSGLGFGLKPNGSDTPFGVFGNLKARFVKNPTTTGGAL